MQTPKNVLWRDRTKNLRDDLIEPAVLAILMAVLICAMLIAKEQSDNPGVATLFTIILSGILLYALGEICHILYRIFSVRKDTDPLESVSIAELQQMLDEAQRAEARYLQIENQLRNERQTLYEVHQLQCGGYQKRRDELTDQINHATHLVERRKNQHQIELYQKLLRAKTRQH